MKVLPAWVFGNKTTTTTIFFFFFFFFFFKRQNRGCGLYGAAALSPANTVLHFCEFDLDGLVYLNFQIVDEIIRWNLSFKVRWRLSYCLAMREITWRVDTVSLDDKYKLLFISNGARAVLHKTRHMNSFIWVVLIQNDNPGAKPWIRHPNNQKISTSKTEYNFPPSSLSSLLNSPFEFLISWSPTSLKWLAPKSKSIDTLKYMTLTLDLHRRRYHCSMEWVAMVTGWGGGERGRSSCFHACRYRHQCLERIHSGINRCRGMFWHCEQV